MISAPTVLRYGRLESVGEGFRPLPNRHRAISREGTEALPYECTMSLSGTVGAVCDRPWANAVRLYGATARLCCVLSCDKIFTFLQKTAKNMLYCTQIT